MKPSSSPLFHAATCASRTARIAASRAVGAGLPLDFARGPETVEGKPAPTPSIPEASAATNKTLQRLVTLPPFRTQPLSLPAPPQSPPGPPRARRRRGL